MAVQFAMLAFEDMVKLARPGAVTECLSDEAITELVFALARTNQPKHLIRVLGVLVEDGRPLPIQTLVPINMDGLSFVTSWVPAALENARTLQEVEGERTAFRSATLLFRSRNVPGAGRSTLLQCESLSGSWERPSVPGSVAAPFHPVQS